MSYRTNTIPLKIIIFANEFFQAYMEGKYNANKYF